MRISDGLLWCIVNDAEPGCALSSREPLSQSLEGVVIGRRVSGPRGVGKSTILQFFGTDAATSDGRDLRLVVPAPVDYEPREFIIHLFSQLCEGVLHGAADRSAIAAETGRHLEQLRYLRTYTTSWSASLAPRSFLALARGYAKERAEQPVTLPELVDSFRGYSARVASWQRSAHGVDGAMPADPRAGTARRPRSGLPRGRGRTGRTAPRRPDRPTAASVSLTCRQAGRESSQLIVGAGRLRCSVNGLPVQDRSPQRFSRVYSLSRMGPRTLPDLQVAEGGLDGAPDEALVGLPGGYVPFGDRGVLVHQPRHGRVRLGRAAFGCFLEKSAEFDLRLEPALDRGPEADLLPGERIGSGVHRDPV